jgi:1-acyl-sn-glycerol-3-phosphate acyltransferase
MVRTTGRGVRKPRRRKGWSEQQSLFVYRVTATLIGLILRFWVRRFRALGTENVPASGGSFLIANHTTAMDPFLLSYPIRQRVLCGPGKIELFKNPLVGYVMQKIGMFPLRQDVIDAAAVRTMVELYRHGRLVIIYPEGGRSRSGEMMPFTPDFARLVIRLKAPLIAAAIAGGKEVLPIGSLIPRPNTAVVVAYGEQFELSEYYDRELTPETVQQATAILEERVAALLEVARRERARL